MGRDIGLVVMEHFDIDLDELAHQADRGPYHEKVFDFVNQVWEMEVSDLTSKQLDWLLKIQDEQRQ